MDVSPDAAPVEAPKEIKPETGLEAAKRASWLDQLGLMGARGLRRRLVRTRELPKARSQVIKALKRRDLDHRLVCLGKLTCSPTRSTTARWHSHS